MEIATLDERTENQMTEAYRNIHYKTDAEYVVHVARKLLTPIGIWPLDKGDSTSDRIKAVTQNVVVFCLMCFLVIPHLIYTYFDAEELKKMMKVIAAQVFSSLALIKYWMIIINRKEIRFYLLEMEKQYRDVQCEEDRLVMVRNAKIGRLFTLMYLSLSYGGALPYHIILPLIAEREVKEDNTTQIPLPYLSDYIFFVVESSPMYEIFFVGQIFISSIILTTNCGVYSLIASSVTHACCLFEVVSRQLNAIYETFGEEFFENHDLQKQLGNVIRQHKEAIRFAESIEESWNVVFLSEMLGCTLIICFLEYGVLQEMEDGEALGLATYVVLMTSIFVNVFIISYVGDRLKSESERIGESSYFVKWYYFPKKVTRDLTFIMIRTSRPSALTGKKMFDLSLQGFCEVCKTSAAYLNFIRAVIT